MNLALRTLLAPLLALTLAACAPSTAEPGPRADGAPAGAALRGRVSPIVDAAPAPAEAAGGPEASPEPPAPPAAELAPPRDATRAPGAAAPAADTPAPTAEPTAVPTAPPAPTAEPAPPTPEPYGRLGASAPTRIRIESIGLDRDLVHVGLDAGNAPVVPDYDVAWYARSASPGAGENVVVWGHALRFSATADIPAPLERVSEARVGDRVTVMTADGAAHEYVIREQIWATPDQVRYILPVGSERLTIVNCIGDYVVDETGAVVSMTHRLITVAEPLR